MEYIKQQGVEIDFLASKCLLRGFEDLWSKTY